MWGATCFSAFPLVATVFQSTLPVWGATSHLVCNCTILGISIHAPRVGSDPASVTCWYPAENFNPRSPCGERHSSAFHVILSANFNPRSPCGERRGKVGFPKFKSKFQSTLPVWGATGKITRVRPDALNFNPRSPCGERHKRSAFRAGDGVFQSTLPVWGATIGSGLSLIHI